ncbi:unnamed protein product [Prunus armeniaca]
MEWLVYSIVLAIGFHSKPTKSLVPPYYVVPEVLDSIRYRLVHEIGLFSVCHCISLKTNQITPPTVRRKFVLKWSGCCIP